MADLQPFRALRFDPTAAKISLTSLLAPPYDVIDESGKQALLRRSPDNIVRIDLPHMPPKSAGPPATYERAAGALNDLIERGVLRRDDKPALYAYHQVFTLNGQSVTRRMLIARVRLQPFEDGVILPHEKTFGGPKEDRLALMKATRVNLSPIFGLYRDKGDLIRHTLEVGISQESSAAGTLDNVENKLWVISDSTTLKAVVKEMTPKKIYIADGHHRYSTALLYRDWLAQQNGGTLPNDHPAHFVMFVLANMDDPGCVILPYHRALADVALDTLTTAWSTGTEAASRGKADIVLVDGSGRKVPLKFTKRDALRAAQPGQCAPWYELDCAYLHHYLIDRLLTEKLGYPPKMRYAKSAQEAESIAQNEACVALLMNATPLAQLQAVSEAGGLMPQKSTYFYPKLATGMTINPLW